MTSQTLFKRAKQLMPGGVNSPVRAFRSVGGAPFFVKAAHGAMLVTEDDRELIDFVCTWGPAIHGHNHPRIKAAIAAAQPHRQGLPGRIAGGTGRAVASQVGRPGMRHLSGLR